MFINYEIADFETQEEEGTGKVEGVGLNDNMVEDDGDLYESLSSRSRSRIPS